MATGPELNEVLARLSEALERLSGAPTQELPFTLQQLLAVLVKHKGVFLHLNAGSPPTLRVNSDLVPIGQHVLTAADCRFVLYSVLNTEQRRLLALGHELDFNHIESGHGFRFHVYQERGCPSAAIRRIRTDIPKLGELGLGGGVVEQFLAESQGLLLLSGKPRCGKINTFASLTSHLNQTRRVRIVTIEPMIQFWHQNAEGNVIQREIGVDTLSFAQAVRQAVQQDPDVLAIGSIPDRETAEVVIQAAAGGHLVIALLDAPSSIRAVDEMLAAFHGTDGRMQQLFGRVLRAVVCQHLVNRADGRGQVPAYEILQGSNEARRLISGGEISYLHQVMRDEGQQTLARTLSRMIEVGSVTREEALQYVDADELEVAPAHAAYAAEPPRVALMDDATPLMSWL